MRRIRTSLAGTAHLFFSGAGGGTTVTAVSAAITRIEGAVLTLRCARPRSMVAGTTCVVVVATDEGQRRARGTIQAVTDLCTHVKLEEPLEAAERRVWPRADVVLRLMARLIPRVGAREPAPRHLSVVPADGGWRTEAVVLSGMGLRGPLDASLAVGDLLELRLHVPGRGGGDHFVTRAEVLQVFDDESPVEHSVRFLDLTDAARSRVCEIVDQARLADLDPEDSQDATDRW